MRKFTAGLVLTAIIIGLWASKAQAEYPLPLRKSDGQICFSDERCPDPWGRYLGRSSGYFARERGWYCERKNRFCWTEGLGHGCACSTKAPSESDWARSRRRRLNYRAEIARHVINPCADGLAKKIGLYDPKRPYSSRQAMKKMLRRNFSDFVRGIRSLMIVEVPFHTRMQLYRYAKAICLKANEVK